MGELREKFRQHMVLRGLAKKTMEGYEHAMVDLVRAYGKSPDTLTNNEIQQHLGYLVGNRKLEWNTINVYFSAYRCFFQKVLGWTDARFSIPKRGRSRKRPLVLDRDTVRRILDAPRSLKHRAMLTLVYGSGLRVSEVVTLKPHHIESAPDRMMVRVEQAKCRKDRYTILSQQSLDLLRAYWRKYRPDEWLFPGFGCAGHMAKGSAQRVYYMACEEAGVKNVHGIHGLRHAFATHLLEQGTDLLVIKRCLGHSSLSTTAQYCHLSADHLRQVRSPADTLYQAP